MHVLCFGITPDDHEWLQAHSGNVEECAEYLRGNEIACALAHPFYAVAAPLARASPAPARRAVRDLGDPERLAGPRAEPPRRGSSPRPRGSPASAAPTITPASTSAGRGRRRRPRPTRRTVSRPPPRRAGPSPAGEEGSAAKWAHAAIAIAARSFLTDHAPPAPPPRRGRPRAARAHRRRGPRSPAAPTAASSAPTTPAPCWPPGSTPLGIASRPGADRADADVTGFATATCSAAPAACTMRACERRRRTRPAGIADARQHRRGAPGPLLRVSAGRPLRPGDRVPRRRARTPRRRHRAARRGSRSSSTRSTLPTASLTRSSGSASSPCPASRSRSSAPTAASTGACPPSPRCRCPTTRGCTLGVPSLPETVEMLADGRLRPDPRRHAGPGRAGRGADRPDRPASRWSRATTPSSSTTRGCGPATRRLAATTGLAMSLLYRECEIVLSPSTSADASLERLGVPPERVARWIRGVDTERFSPEHRTRALDGTSFDVLYAGRLTREKGIDLLADAFTIARRFEPRLRLDPRRRRTRGGRSARAARRRHRASRLARRRRARPAYADADAFLFASRDRHLRPGRRRGPGQRPAGRRGRDGRPRRPDRARAQRSARRARRPRARGQARPPRPEPAPARPARRRRDGGGARAHLGSFALPARRRLLAGRRAAPTRRSGRPAFSSRDRRPPEDARRSTVEAVSELDIETGRRRRQRRPRSGCPLRARRRARRGHRPRGLLALLQPRAVVDGLQRPGPPARRGHQRCRCSSGSSSAPSTRATSTSSTWCVSPASTTRSSPR